jgi:hypothetical protein
MHEHILSILLSNELIWGQQRRDVGMAMATQKLNLAVNQHLLTNSHAI